VNGPQKTSSFAKRSGIDEQGPCCMMSFLSEAIGRLSAAGIRQWVRLTGKRVARREAPWLDCPMGPPGRIGAEFYNYLADREDLRIVPTLGAGLLPSFDALRGPHFDPGRIRPEVRDFYEHTSFYRLEAWSEAALSTRYFLWGLTTFVSRKMNQLNFPVSSLELAGGMTSDILPMVRSNGQQVYTGWLRRVAATDRVIYTGLYSVQQLPGYSNPCVKVSFPLPFGSSTVFLRPETQPDGSFKLISSGARFGEPGFYRMVETDGKHWRVRYIRTLREFFHVYVDREGTLRTDHTVHFLGLTPLRLHYKLERVGPRSNAGSAGSPLGTGSAEPVTAADGGA
jgi:hypothetical protein